MRCCTAAYHTITKRDNEASQELRALLNRFLANQTCTEHHDSDDYRYQLTLSYHIKVLIFETADETRVGIWDELVGSKYPNLKVTTLRQWSSSDEAILLGNTGVPKAIMCGLAHYSGVIGGAGVTCACVVYRRRDKETPG